MRKVQKVLGRYHSKSPRCAYRKGLEKYFTFIYGEEADVEEQAERYLSTGRNYEEDLTTA